MSLKIRKAFSVREVYGFWKGNPSKTRAGQHVSKSARQLFALAEVLSV
jgi:hypothetical protein